MNCLVTGGSRGIGWKVAERLAKEGHNVTISARNAELLAERVEQLPKVDEKQIHSILPLDLADRNASLDIKQPFNVFINSAGISPAALLAVQPLKSIEETLQVNLQAPIGLAKSIVRGMLRQKQGGDIIFLSSVLASKGLAGTSVYAASKAGLEGFTRSLAREVGAKSIKVNCIAPGLVDTDMGRSADPATMTGANIIPGLIDAEAIADTVMFILKNKHLTGQILTVDNGFSV